MKQKIDYRIILLLISISILLNSISGDSIIFNILFTSIFDMFLYLIISSCIIILLNIDSHNTKGLYLSFKTDILIIISSILYLLLKIAISSIFKWIFIDSSVSIIIFIIVRYILLVAYIILILLIIQEKHDIKHILLKAIYITLIIATLILVLSLLNTISNIILKNITQVIIITFILIGVYIIKLNKS